VFSGTAAESLRAALTLAGSPGEVVVPPDDLSLGPLAATEERDAWFERELGLALEENDGARADFWSAALDPGRPRTVWWSRRAAREHRGFLELVWQLADEPCATAGLSDAAASVGVAKTLAPPPPEQIVGGGLLGRAEPSTAARRAVLRPRWSRLREEDAPLRVPTGGGGIESVPLSLFDDALIRNTAEEWRPTAHSVVEALCGDWETGLCRTSDHLLAARVHALAAAGRMELRGGDPRRTMAGTEIRLPGRAAPAGAP
jgi:Protein of unknown function/Domain of unknown function (DUF1835)